MCFLRGDIARNTPLICTRLMPFDFIVTSLSSRARDHVLMRGNTLEQSVLIGVELSG